MHAGAVGVEDPHDLDVGAVLPVVIEEQGLGAALALVVAAARANWIHIAPVVLGLGVDLGVAVDLTGRELQDPGIGPLGQPEHIDGAVHAGLGRLDGVVLVVHGARRAGQVVDAIDLDIEGEGDVMSHQFKVWLAEQVIHVALSAREVVVDAEDILPQRH